jgi:hypothetical protein
LNLLHGCSLQGTLWVFADLNWLQAHVSLGGLALQEGCFLFIQFNISLLLVKLNFIQVNIDVWFINHLYDAAAFEP